MAEALDMEAVAAALAEMDQEVRVMVERQAEIVGADLRRTFDLRTYLAGQARQVARRLNAYADVLELFPPGSVKDS